MQRIAFGTVMAAMLVAALPKVLVSYTLAITTSVGSTAVSGFSSGEVCARIREAAPARIEAESTTGVRVLTSRCRPSYVADPPRFEFRPAPVGDGT